MMMWWKTGWLSALLAAGLCAGTGAGLISYHPFDEGKGTTAADATGNGNNGTFTGAIQWVPGKKGSAVRFDTAGERIVIGKINPSGANKAMTLAAWIYWEGSNHATITHMGIFGKRGGWADPGDTVKWFWEAQPDDDLAFRTYSTSVTVTRALAKYQKEWAHVAVTWDNGTLIHYINGVQVHKGSITFNEASNDVLVSIGCTGNYNSETFVGVIDEARIYDTALPLAGILQAMTGDTTSASAPEPAVGATDVPRDVTLSWTAGDSAATHNVYFGTSSEDVNAADLSKTVSPGQTGTTFKPAGPLEYGKTYYWRVDEVNAPPSAAVRKGGIWSFTVEPYAYPIAGVTATASSFQTGMGPEMTINGSGMTGDLHGVAPTTMWLSAGTPPNWIQYDLGKVYKVHEMWVWNSNQLIEAFMGFGAKRVVIETSLDGTTWTPVANVPEFARAPGTAGYAANTTVSLDVDARYVKLTIESNWSGLTPNCGLSEVRFFWTPIAARAPQPAQYGEGVPVDAALDWRPGREATSHKVFFSTDRAAVAAGTAPAQTVTEHGFDASPLDFGTFYYWRVDEIGATTTYPGSIWSFTTQQFAVVEDFESYTDKAGEEVFTAWVDGMTNSSGSIVGLYPDAVGGTFCEKTIVHGGKQSAPFEYNNVKTPFYSEAERTFDTPQDWTVHAADTLALWYRGYPGGFVDRGNNAFTVSSEGTDIWNAGDQFRFIYKPLSGDGSITVNVESLINTNAWAKAGVMIRETLEPNARMAYAIISFSSGVAFGQRANAGANAIDGAPTIATVRPPQWVKLTRKGNTFTAQYSADGKTWLDFKNPALTGTIASPSITMAPNAYVGLCVTSHSAGVYTTAEFSNVATSGTVSGAWQTVSIGVTQWDNGAAPLYVTVADKAGKSKTVVNTNPAAVNTSAWTQWQIALSDLAGVNLAAVKKLTIGVGDKTNPKASGAGKLYFDDIQFGKPIPPVGLVAAFSFENDVKDSSGNGHDGTLLGTPTYVDGPAGKGKALLFPGTTGTAVNLGTFNPSEKTGMLTVSLWAKWNGLSGLYQGLIGKRDNWTDEETMWQIEASQTTGVLSLGRYNASLNSGNKVLPVGEWTHIAVTFDKTTTRFYVNGVQTASSATWSFGPDREASLQIGCDSANGGNPFNGAIDEVKLYDIALTPAEILALAAK